MDWKKMLNTQRILDDRILEEKRLEDKLTAEELLEGRILALKVELAEFANETRCFKFWSNKGPSEKKVRLEEAVDALHFYLSIGNTLRMDAEWFRIAEWGYASGGLVHLFNRAYHYLERPEITDIHASFLYFVGAVIADGHTLEEMETAYYAKNAVNHQRQDAGY